MNMEFLATGIYHVIVMIAMILVCVGYMKSGSL